MSQPPLLTLAPEVKLRIFSELSDLDLIHCSALPKTLLMTPSQVCSLFRQVIARSALLQYRIELSFEGLVDGHPEEPNVSDRLRRLVDRRSNWLDLKWTEHEPLSVQTHISHYAPGVFLTHKPINNNGDGSCQLLFHTLPSLETRWETREGPFRERQITSMTCDPSQDLFIIFERDDPTWDEDEDIMSNAEFRFHFLTLSSLGEIPHPHAIAPMIEAEYLPNDDYETVLSVMGDLLGVWGNLGVDITVRIINWKTGDCITEIEAYNCPSSLSMIPGAFGFATPELLVFFSAAHGTCLQIQPIPMTSRRSLILCLPTPKSLRYGMDPRIFENEMTSNLRPEAPFLDSRVYQIDISEAQLALFFKHASLMSLMKEHFWSHSSNEPVVVPWKEWGPRHTRAVKCRTSLNEDGCMHGSRAILRMADMAGTQDTPADVTPYILDFNMIRHERPMLPSADAASNGQWTLVSEPTTLSTPTFEEPIVTSLPFYVATAPGPGRHRRYCIDDQRVVGFSMAPRPTPGPGYTFWTEDKVGEVTVYSF